MQLYPVLNKQHPLKQASKALASKALVVVLPLFVLASCGGGGDSTGGGGATFKEFSQSSTQIANVASIMNDGYAQLNTSVAALNASVIDYCADAASIADAAKRTAAQDAFKVAMNDVQHSLLHGVGIFAFGPAAHQERGMEVLYSWPTINNCEIDRNLAQNKTALNLALNQKGVDALEYLLFVEEDAGHSCPMGATPVTDLATFKALPPADQQALRCAYMLPVAADAVVTAQRLADDWNPAIGNYVETMTSNPNIQSTMNDITDVMYYLREDFREFKLDSPLGGGLTNTKPVSCDLGTLCPQDVESPTALVSKENLRANILSFQQLYWGGSDRTAVGFDDWLSEVQGDSVLAGRMDVEIQAILTALDAIDGTWFDAINNDNNDANAVLDAVDVVSDSLRFDMLPALALSVPTAKASDTD